MSYRNPKYTYVSDQPYYTQLTNTLAKVGQDISKAKSDYAEEQVGINKARTQAGRGANQAYVTDAVKTNTYGNKTTQGAIHKLFQGTGKRVGEITMATEGADPQCEIDGNCDELYAELAMLNRGPEDIKNFTENMLTELNYKDIKNFDESQGGNFILAANILNQEDMTTPAYGYSYDIQYATAGDPPTQDGTYDWVFKFDEAKAREQLAKDGKTPEEIDKLIPGLKFDGKDTFSINSGGLKQNMANGDIFVETPNMTEEMDDIISSANIISEFDTDKNGKRIPGTGSFNVEDFMIEGIYTQEQTGTLGKGKDAVAMFENYVSIDRNKVANRLEFEIDQKMDYYSQPQNQGQAIAMYNKVLSGADTTNLDLERIELETGFKFERKDGKLKPSLESWASEWNNKDGLSAEKLGLFKHLLKNYAVDEVTKTLESEAYKNQRKYNPNQVVTISDNYNTNK